MTVGRTRDRVYQANRKRLFENYDVCWLCGQWIDPELKFPHNGCKTADHVLPIAKGGHMHGAIMPAHLGCNRSRGAKLPPVKHARGW
jgi:hypothetical protein